MGIKYIELMFPTEVETSSRLVTNPHRDFLAYSLNPLEWSSEYRCRPPFDTRILCRSIEKRLK